MATPKDPVVIEAAMDPAEVVDYALGFQKLLQDYETIDPDQVTVALDANAAALGITLWGDRPPALTRGKTAIQIWLSVDEAQRNNAAFDEGGTTVLVQAHVRTNATPYRELERTYAITIRHR